MAPVTRRPRRDEGRRGTRRPGARASVWRSGGSTARSASRSAAAASCRTATSPRVRWSSCPRAGTGALEITLLGKSGAPIDVRVNGIPVRTIVPPPGAVVDARDPDAARRRRQRALRVRAPTRTTSSARRGSSSSRTGDAARARSRALRSRAAARGGPRPGPEAHARRCSIPSRTSSGSSRANVEM